MGWLWNLGESFFLFPFPPVANGVKKDLPDRHLFVQKNVHLPRLSLKMLKERLVYRTNFLLSLLSSMFFFAYGGENISCCSKSCSRERVNQLDPILLAQVVI